MSRHYKILILVISIALLPKVCLAQQLAINTTTFWVLQSTSGIPAASMETNYFYVVRTATVTAVFEEGVSDNIFYIDDGSGRGVVCYAKPKIISDLAIGDVVNVSGYINQFIGETQINITFASPFGTISRLKKANDGGAEIPEPRIIWTRDLADMTDTTANGGRGNGGQLMEGDLVKIRKVKKMSGTWPSTDAMYYDYLIADASGQLYLYWDRKAYGLHIDGTETIAKRKFIEPKGYMDITGNANQFDSYSPHFSNYLIRPRNAFDIIDVPDDLTVLTSTDGSRELRWDPGQSELVQPHSYFKWWNIYRSTDGSNFIHISTTTEEECVRYFRDAPDTT
ncbi:MAG: hypothetical protein ABIJ11_00005, partial [Elusimicrobiota bacterium]